MGSISILTYCSIFTNTNRHDAPYSLLSIHILCHIHKYRKVCCSLHTCTSYIAPPPNVRHNQQTNCASCTSISMLGASDRLQMPREPMDREVVDLCPSLQHRVYCVLWATLLGRGCSSKLKGGSVMCANLRVVAAAELITAGSPPPLTPPPPPPPPPPPYTQRVSNLSLTLRRPPLSLN